MSKSRVAIAAVPRLISPQVIERMYFAGAVVIGIALALNCLSLLEAVMRFVPLLNDPKAEGMALYTFSELVALSMVCAILHSFRCRITAAAKELVADH